MKKSISNMTYSNKYANESTRLESLQDSIIKPNIQNLSFCNYDDTLAQELFISSAYEHIKEIRELIADSRINMRPLRQQISQLQQSIQSLEHQQRKEQISIEYELSSSLHRLRQQFSQQQIVQQGENTLLQEQLARLNQDDQELNMELNDLEFRIQNLAPEIGQYSYKQYLD